MNLIFLTDEKIDMDLLLGKRGSNINTCLRRLCASITYLAEISGTYFKFLIGDSIKGKRIWLLIA